MDRWVVSLDGARRFIVSRLFRIAGDESERIRIFIEHGTSTLINRIANGRNYYNYKSTVMSNPYAIHSLSRELSRIGLPD